LVDDEQEVRQPWRHHAFERRGEIERARRRILLDDGSTRMRGPKCLIGAKTVSSKGFQGGWAEAPGASMTTAMSSHTALPKNVRPLLSMEVSSLRQRHHVRDDLDTASFRLFPGAVEARCRCARHGRLGDDSQLQTPSQQGEVRCA
jgi:hypothetical protein